MAGENRKIFLIRNFLRFDEYYFVSRQRTIYELKGTVFRPISRDAFFERIQRNIMDEIRIIIDEFHRLPQDFQDLLQALKPKAQAQLILITSSMFFVEKILGPKSPLLGIVTPVRIDIIKPTDIVRELSRVISDPNLLLQVAVYARELILLEHLGSTKTLSHLLGN